MKTDSVLYLNENWLDSTSETVSGSGVLSMSGGVSGWVYHDVYYPWYTPYYPWPVTYTVETKIRLKLSEIEHLRKAAAKDAKLKAVLKKFAPHVEVEVDF